MAFASGVGATAQEIGLQATQETRTAEESIWNIGTATLMGSLLEHGESVDRGPLLNAAAALVREGNTDSAVGILDINARHCQPELVSAALHPSWPSAAVPMAFAGNCLSPLISDGDIIAVDLFTGIEPGDVANFACKDEPFHYAKLFVGLTDCSTTKSVMNQTEPGTVAIFWMANPDKFVTVPMNDLAYVAKVMGRVGSTTGYQAFDPWPHPAFPEAEAIRFGDSLSDGAMEPFGSPPLALVEDCSAAYCSQ